jgi:hypothetical protein
VRTQGSDGHTVTEFALLVGWCTRSASLTHAGLLFGALAGCRCVNRDVSENVLTTIPAGGFADLTNLKRLYVYGLTQSGPQRFCTHVAAVVPWVSDVDVGSRALVSQLLLSDSRHSTMRVSRLYSPSRVRAVGI